MLNNTLVFIHRAVRFLLEFGSELVVVSYFSAASAEKKRSWLALVI